MDKTPERDGRPLTEAERASTPKDPEKRHIDKHLDEGLDESFPASDPVAVGHPEPAPKPQKNQKK